MKSTLKIGRREYEIVGTYKRNNNGQDQTWTELKGKRGAEVYIVEDHCKYGTVTRVFEIGNKNPWRTIEPHIIRR